MRRMKRILGARGGAVGLACIFWAVLVLAPRVIGVELKAGPEVEAGSRHAIIRWETDVPAGGRLEWGTRPDQLRRRQQGPTGTRHELVLKDLLPETRYHFAVGTARRVLGTHSFTTVAEAVAAAPSIGISSQTNAQPAPVGVGGVSGAGGPTASPVAQPQAPPARISWGSYRTLQDHFDRHGRDFGARDPEDYARSAWLFFQRAKKEGLPAKRDLDGILRIYDPATRAFGAYNRDGTTRTYFKPGRRDYFRDQPGRPVDRKQER